MRAVSAGVEVELRFAHRLRAIGHLFEAEDESQEWPELHAVIREAPKRYQAAEQMPDWNGLDGMLAAVREQIKHVSA
jgi:hypothetical protein